MDFRPLYLPVEIKTRELKAKTLIALFACARGFQVCLSQKDAFNAFSPQLQPGIVVGKSLNMVDARHFAQYRDHGHAVATMDEEMLIYISRADAVRYMSREAVTLSGLIFVPGDDAAELIAAIDPAAAARTRNVGLPRLDFLRPAFAAPSLPRVEELRARYGDFVLVNCNFNLNNAQMPYNRLMEVLRTGGYVRNPADKAFVDARINYEWRVLAAQNDLVAALAKRFPAVNFIVRPHPQENQTLYFERFTGAANILVSPPAESVDVWLRAAVAVIQHGCTTAIEAHELGAPTLNSALVVDARYDTFLPAALSDAAGDVDATALWLNAVLCNRSRRPHREILSNGRPYQYYIDRGAGETSSQRVADALAAWPTAQTHADAPGRLSLSAFAHMPYVAAPFDKNEFIALKFPDTPLAEIKALTEQFRAALPELPPVHIQSPARDVFVITPA